MLAIAVPPASTSICVRDRLSRQSDGSAWASKALTSLTGRTTSMGYRPSRTLGVTPPSGRYRAGAITPHSTGNTGPGVRRSRRLTKPVTSTKIPTPTSRRGAWEATRCGTCKACIPAGATRRSHSVCATCSIAHHRSQTRSTRSRSDTIPGTPTRVGDGSMHESLMPSSDIVAGETMLHKLERTASTLSAPLRRWCLELLAQQTSQSLLHLCLVLRPEPPQRPAHEAMIESEKLEA